MGSWLHCGFLEVREKLVFKEKMSFASPRWSCDICRMSSTFFLLPSPPFIFSLRRSLFRTCGRPTFVLIFHPRYGYTTSHLPTSFILPEQWFGFRPHTLLPCSISSGCCKRPLPSSFSPSFQLLGLRMWLHSPVCQRHQVIRLLECKCRRARS